MNLDLALASLEHGEAHPESHGIRMPVLAHEFRFSLASLARKLLLPQLDDCVQKLLYSCSLGENAATVVELTEIPSAPIDLQQGFSLSVSA